MTILVVMVYVRQSESSLCYPDVRGFSLCVHAFRGFDSAPPPQGEDQVEHRAGFNFVRCGGIVIAHLTTRKDEPLLDGGDALAFLHAFFDALYRVPRLDVDLDLLARQGLDLDEHRLYIYHTGKRYEFILC